LLCSLTRECHWAEELWPPTLGRAMGHRDGPQMSGTCRLHASAFDHSYIYGQAIRGLGGLVAGVGGGIGGTCETARVRDCLRKYCLPLEQIGERDAAGRTTQFGCMSSV